MTCNVYVMHVITCNNILGVSLMTVSRSLSLRVAEREASGPGPGSRSHCRPAAASESDAATGPGSVCGHRDQHGKSKPAVSSDSELA
jgi:hypothetical protein